MRAGRTHRRGYASKTTTKGWVSNLAVRFAAFCEARPAAQKRAAADAHDSININETSVRGSHAPYNSIRALPHGVHYSIVGVHIKRRAKDHV